jgi:enterobactin synthetase component D
VNEPVLSTTFAALFPEDAVAAELRGFGDPSRLKPEEARSVERAVPKRRKEFAAGRQCARRALAELGLLDVAVLAAPDRQPIWPPEIIGSITHTAGLCAAVVSPSARLASIGVDTEICGAVKPELWPTICVAEESAWIGSLAPAERAAAVTLLFCGKEAFYKCQYPLTAERLGFDDVCLTVHAWGQGGGAFSVRPVRPLALFERPGARESLQGRYRLHEQFVSAGMCVTRR